MRKTCVTTADEVATTARLRAWEAQRAQIRAVPPFYRDAALRASVFTDARVRPEFFLALAYNRTLYGELLKNSGTRRYAGRGPLQWDLRKFGAVALPGHQNATQPLDSFLAVAQALRRTGILPDGDAFDLSRRLGNTVDEARADAVAFDVLVMDRPATPLSGLAATPKRRGLRPA